VVICTEVSPSVRHPCLKALRDICPKLRDRKIGFVLSLDNFFHSWMENLKKLELASLAHYIMTLSSGTRFGTILPFGLLFEGPCIFLEKVAQQKGNFWANFHWAFFLHLSLNKQIQNMFCCICFKVSIVMLLIIWFGNCLGYSLQALGKFFFNVLVTLTLSTREA
jgi:hypothetical protein